MHVERNVKKVEISIEQSEDICAILIEDNGCGIPESDLPHIYEKGFYEK